MGLRALSLPGCGCRGAFQCGVMADLARRGETFDLVAGASSGSITGAVTVAGLGADGPDMWRQMASTPIVGARYLRTQRSVFGMSAILRDALERFVPIDRIVTSEAELLIGTTRVRRFARGLFGHAVGRMRGAMAPMEPPRSSLAASLVRAGSLAVHSSRTRRDIHDLILASCTIPGIYAEWPIIDGEVHIDGGATDNTLIAELLARGADEITVVTPYPPGAASPTMFEAEARVTVPKHVKLRIIYPERRLRQKRFGFERGPMEEALTMTPVEEVFEF